MAPQSTTTQSNGAPGTPAQAPNPIISFMPMIVIVGILYMLVIRPQQKQAKELRKMVDSLKKGDRVLTQGGLYGTVVNLKGPVLELKIADNVKVDVARSCVTQVIQEPTAGTPNVISGAQA